MYVSNQCINWFVKECSFEDNKKAGDFKDWAFTVEETSEKKDAEVEGISIADITYYNSWQIIDIEGAERYLFQNKYIKLFYREWNCLVMEIHDEYKIRQLIYNILREENFEWIDAGELTIAANHNLC